MSYPPLTRHPPEAHTVQCNATMIHGDLNQLAAGIPIHQEGGVDVHGADWYVGGKGQVGHFH